MSDGNTETDVPVDDIELRITYLTPERFFAPRQVGITIVQDWYSFARWLTWPTRTEQDDREAKTIAGAWCPCALADGVVKGGDGPSRLLVADVDNCGADGFARSVDVLAEYRGCVVTSCNATDDDTRHRIVLVTSRVMTADERAIAWRQMSRVLEHAGVVIDKGCKNGNRLYYASVWKRAGIFNAHYLKGALIAVDAMIESARAEDEAELAARPKPKPIPKENRDKYIAGAIRKARANVESADAGARHDTLLRETFSLARFDLSEDEIADALLDSFVFAAGDARRVEGERAIRDAYRARQGAA